MDPDANLEEQRELAERLAEGHGDEADLLRLAELVLALDRWMTAGGALPERWHGLD